MEANLSTRARTLAAAFALSGLLWAPANAAAPVVYDNGPPVISGYNTVGRWIANDFTFDSTWSIVMLRYYFLVYQDEPDDLDTVVWEIYTDDRGRPGARVGGASVSSTGSQTLVGSTDYFNLYAVDLRLTEPLTLDPGHYWLGVTTPSYGYVYWADSTATGTQNAMFWDADDPGVWYPLGRESAFQISAVPEPQQAVSLALGLAVLCAWRRRSRGHSSRRAG
ncbi:MAG TPA: hypothetical protein VFT37_07420 [Telluria sp.]|nr:hypothetical protein [Telluria sp.]